jgi:hypothetical protein
MKYSLNSVSMCLKVVDTRRVDGRDQKYRGLRIETTLTDERGDALRLKARARVDVTATAKEVNSQR